MRKAGVLLGALCLAASGLRAAEPECATRCRGLAARGELREGVSEQGCRLSLCPEEGRRLYSAAAYDRAFEAFALVEPQLATQPEFQLDLGRVEAARGNFARALAAFDRALERNPDDLRAGAQRSRLLVRLERFDDARAQLEKLLALPPARTDLQGLDTGSYLRGHLGALRLIQGDAPGARELLEKALALDAGNTLAATYLYRVLPEVEAGRMDGRGVWLMMQAAEDLELLMLERAGAQLAELVTRAPEFAEAYYLQADLLRVQGQFEACEAALRRGEERLPKNASLRAERLRCQLLRVREDAARRQPVIDELVALGREHPDDERIRNILLALSGR
jgi:tetratricopeptide (TPR) repeat protein